MKSHHFEVLGWVFTSFVFGLSASVATLGAEFEVSGRIVAHYPNTPEIVRDFEVAVKDCRGVIITKKVAPASALATVNEFSTDDGTNSYFLTRVDLRLFTNAFQFTRNGKTNAPIDISKIKLKNEATLQVEPTVVPDMGENLVAPVWLAYGSQCYFASMTNRTRAQPVYSVVLESQGSKPFVKSDWELDPRSRSLDHIDFFEEGVRYSYVLGKLKLLRDPALEKGHTNAAFRVLTWTNYGDLWVPLEFTMSLDIGVGTNASPTLVTAHGMATSIRGFTTVTAFVPEIPMKTAVVERRLFSDDPPVGQVKYFTTNGLIKSVMEVKATTEYRDALASHAAALKRRRERFVVYLCFVAVILLPIVLTAMRRRGSSVGIMQQQQLKQT